MEIKKGFYKVFQSGGSYVTATFFNPETKEEYSKCVRDYDYADCSRDDDEGYNAEINEEARKAWKHHNGVICEGDKVKVVKGKKIPLGTIATVKSIYPYYDCYHRWIADYVYFVEGGKTNINNCVLA